jgi:uncharacterized protein (TIGR00251 family)
VEAPCQPKTDIKVRLAPRSSRDQFLGREGDVYKVKVTAAPVKGMANRALVALLAKRLGVPKKNIEVVSGKSSRLKTVRIRGLHQQEIASILESG